MAVTAWRTGAAATAFAAASSAEAAWTIGSTATRWSAANLAAADSNLPQTLFVTTTTPLRSAVGYVGNFGFGGDIPAGATIDGVEIETRVNSNSGGSTLSLSVLLTKNGTAAVGADLSNGLTHTLGSTFSTWTHGGSANTGGVSLTRDEVVASAFGVLIQTVRVSTSANWVHRVDQVRVRVYYTEAGGALAALGIATDAPVVGSPALTQTHALAASAIETDAPVVGSPALTQAHALAASGIATGAPVTGTPTLGLAGGLVATAIATGAPVVGTPALQQGHVLTATGIATGAPVTGSPALAQAGGLIATGIATGAPVAGSPALSQSHILLATGITAGAIQLGRPALNPELATGDYALAAVWAGPRRISGTWVGAIHIARIR